MSNKTHGMTGTPEHKIWRGIKARCYIKSATGFKNYGGRGITVCKRWLNSFENFYKDMGLRPTGAHSLERVNNNAGYSKRNCVWAGRKTQSRNKRNTVKIYFRKQNLTIPEWSEITGITSNTLYRRMYRGWKVKDILTKPLKRRRK